MKRITVKKLATALKIDSQEAYGFLKFLVAVGLAKDCGRVREPSVKTGAGCVVYEIDIDIVDSRLAGMLRSAIE